MEAPSTAGHWREHEDPEAHQAVEVRPGDSRDLGRSARSKPNVVLHPASSASSSGLLALSTFGRSGTRGAPAL